MLSNEKPEVLKRQLYQICKPTLYWILGMIIVIVVTAIITYLVAPSTKGTTDAIESTVPHVVSNADGVKAVVAYFVNNGIRVPLMMLVLSLIPVAYLYTINVFIGAILPGILFGVAFQHGIQSGVAIVIGASPHALLELLGLCAWIVLLGPLNNWVRDKIRRRKTESLRNVFLPLLRGWVVIVLPSMVIAAFCETYLADRVADFILYLN